MIIFFNGQLVPEEQANISVFDRGFMYGDGIFETLRLFNGKPFRWQEHLERFQRGAEFLKIEPPFSADVLRGFADQLVAKNRMPDSILRLVLTRGPGARGYSPKNAQRRPTMVMSLHPPPEVNSAHPPRWKLIVSSHRLPANEPLAQFKTCNKLPQILARGEADAAGADEALLTNTDGFVVEGSGSNLFWIQNDAVCTAPLASGVLPGVTRAAVLDICGLLRLKVREAGVRPEELRQAQGVFLSLSSFGVVEALALDGHDLKRAALFEEIRQAYAGMVKAG